MVQLGDKDLFVAFRLPKANSFSLVIDEGIQDPAYHFVIHPFDKSGPTPSVAIHSNTLEQNQVFEFRTHRQCKTTPTSKSEYLDLAESVIDRMNATSLEKIVLSRTHHVPNHDTDLFELFDNLMSTYPNAFVYLYNIPGQGAWMGATPEILIEEDPNYITTVALAATQKIAGRTAEEVEWNAKEIEEQAIIQRYIEQQLNQDRQTFKKGKTYTTTAGNVFHLKTVYQIQTSDANLDDLVELLHPGPAICGMPKPEAKSIILNEENHDRKYYCGYLGLKTKSNTGLFINLRCMEIFNDQFVLYVGGGLTKDSSATSEWEETVLKSKTLDAVIQKSKTYAHDH